jgi:hypothetical protein
LRPYFSNKRYQTMMPRGYKSRTTKAQELMSRSQNLDGYFGVNVGAPAAQANNAGADGNEQHQQPVAGVEDANGENDDAIMDDSAEGDDGGKGDEPSTAGEDEYWPPDDMAFSALSSKT